MIILRRSLIQKELKSIWIYKGNGGKINRDNNIEIIVIGLLQIIHHY